MSNSGIQVSGSGKIISNQIVAGTGASAVYEKSVDRSALNVQFLLLEKAILESGLAEEKVKDSLKEAAAVKTEASKDVPDKSRIEQGLQVIKNSMGSVLEIGVTLKSIAELIAG